MGIKQLIEAGKVKQVPEAHNIAYLLENVRLFLNSDYRFMKGQKQDALLSCAKTTFNGKMKLVYFTEGMQPLSVKYGYMNFTAFMEVIENIFEAISEVKKNGFLKPENIDDSLDGIYVDSRTRKVKLLYLPVQNTAAEHADRFMNLRTTLVRLINAAPMYSGYDVQQVCRILEDESPDIENVRRQIQTVRLSGNDVPRVFDEEARSDGTKQLAANLRLISRNSSFAQDFHIHSSEFIIGKSREKADGVIPKGTVSRVHCAIQFVSNEYYVEDLDSTNGTKLNYERIPSRQPRQLHSGDILSIAGVEFLVEF